MPRQNFQQQSVVHWASLLQTAVRERNGLSLSQLVNPTNASQFFVARELIGASSAQVSALAQTVNFGFCQESFKLVFTAFLGIASELLRENSSVGTNWQAVVSSGTSFLNRWIDIYRSPEAQPFSWLIPPLVTFCDFLIHAGNEADRRQESGADAESVFEDERTPAEDGGGLSHNENQERVLNAIRQHIGKFRGDAQRQAAYIVLLCASIKACMQLRNMQMASAFLKTIESSPLSSVSSLPRGPVVSFRFYLGKLYMQQELFSKSEQCLEWAFSNCRPTNPVKKNILECLVASRLRLGKVPNVETLDKYGIGHYRGIVEAVESGNIRKFDETLKNAENLFLHEGTLLCLERVKFVVYRKLIAKAKRWWTAGNEGNIVPIGLFTAAIKWQLAEELTDFDDQEMACIIANLIKLGYVKGYIAWEHAKVVFSKQTAFPVLSSVAVN